MPQDLLIKGFKNSDDKVVKADPWLFNSAQTTILSYHNGNDDVHSGTNPLGAKADEQITFSVGAPRFRLGGGKQANLSAAVTC